MLLSSSGGPRLLAAWRPPQVGCRLRGAPWPVPFVGMGTQGARRSCAAPAQGKTWHGRVWRGGAHQ